MFNFVDTFIFKPADVADTVNPAKVSPGELAASRSGHTKSAVVTSFVMWGKATIPMDAFNFRHESCEPLRTGEGASGNPLNRHAIRYQRSQVRGRVKGGQI